MTGPSPAIGADTSGGRLSARGQLLMLAMAGGVTLAPLYYGQPLLDAIGREFGADQGQVAVVPIATQAGYALGMLAFVPLGDRFDRRPLILILTAGLTMALVVAWASPNLIALALASAVIGATATVTQQIVPLAARSTSDVERGRVLGRIVAGLLTGIAVSWAISGAIVGRLDWRAVFLFAAASCGAVLAILAWSLPTSSPPTRMAAGELYRTLPRLWRRHRELRHASLVQALVFGAYGLFWSNVIHLLRQPPITLDPTSAGLFGLTGIGAAGATLAAGRLSDRGRGHGAILSGIVLTILAFLVSGVSPTLGALVAAGALLGVGMPLSLVPNQARMYRLDPAAGGRLNTLFVASQFIAAAAGAWLGSKAMSVGGWPLAAGIGGAAATIALISEVAWRPRPVRMAADDTQATASRPV